MGVWGDAPWDNDTAADWFGEVFDETKFADRITEGLNADLDEHPEIVRAAAHVVYLLGRAYVWPAGSLKQHLQLAVDRLQALAERDPAPIREIKKEIKELQIRLAPPRPTAQASPKSVETPAVLPTMELKWSLDLANPEQRPNASKLLWGVSPPTVRAIHPLGERWLLAGTNQHLQLLDATTGTLIRNLIDAAHPRNDSDLLVADSGFFVQSGTAVRSLPDGDLVNEWKHQTRRVASKAMTPDGRLLLVLNYDGVLYVNDIESGKERFALEHAPPKDADDSSCVVSPDGMLAATSWKGSICFWDLEAGKLIKKQRNKYAGLQLTSDGHQAISRSGTGPVLWEMETGKKIRTIVGASSGLMGSLISPHNRWVCEISPFKYKDLRGEVQAVRPWSDEDAPYTGSGRVDFRWIDDERLTTWRHVRSDDGKQVWCEVLVWSLHPLKITAVAQLERRQMLIDGGPQSTVRGEIYRIAAASDGRTIFLGDGDAHVYAFNVPS